MSIRDTEHRTRRSGPPAPDGQWRRPDPSVPAGAAGAQTRFGAYGELSRVMLLAFLRDKGAIFFLILFPLMFLMLFGTLFRADGTVQASVAQVGAVPLLDSISAGQRAELEESLTITRFTDPAAALQQVKDGDLDGLIEQGPDDTLLLRYSSANQGQAAALRAIVTSVLQEANLQATGEPATYTLTATQVEDASLKPIQYLTPGLLGWAIATGAVFSSALTLVTLRRRQILRRMWLAPVSAAALVTSRILITTVIALAQTALFLAAATLPFFGLQLSGNWWLVIPLVLCATLAFMSVGMLAGAVSRTEDTANGLSQLIVLPMSFLSGSFFSLDGAPGWLQAVAGLMPLRWLVTGSEAVMVRGGGLSDVLPTMAGLLLFGFVVCAIAWRFFSWED